MKKSKNILLQFFLASAFVIFGVSRANAQEHLLTKTQTQDEDVAINTGNYRTAIGIRFGYTSGLTVKHFFNNGNAFEGIVGTWANAFSLTGLYEWHVPSSVNGLKWYYGVGAHATVYREGYYYYNEGRNGRPFRYYRYDDNGTGVGVDAILGIEYKIPPIPFALSLDLKPNIEFNTNNRVYGALDPGLGIKFTF